MIIKNYSCTLLTDLIVNDTVATSGYVGSLDYLSGSNFLGIVARKLYHKLSSQDAFELFHSGKVKFGNALPAINKNGKLEIAFPMPFSFYRDKVEKDEVYLHHKLRQGNIQPLDGNGLKRQLKQERAGFISEEFDQISVNKNSTLRAARDYDKGTTLQGALYGLEAISKGQVFCCQIQYDTTAQMQLVESVLLGRNQIGKSKYNEFGEVEIEAKILHEEAVSGFDYKNLITGSNTNYSLLYVVSPLCLTNQFGVPELQPSASDLGFDGCSVNWELSQIRVMEYANWNGKRNSLNSARHCISPGSVIYLEGPIKNIQSHYYLGEYQNEGLGLCLLNPKILFSNLRSFNTYEIKQTTLLKDGEVLNPGLAAFVSESEFNSQNTLKRLEDITKLINTSKDVEKLKLAKITSSQWGVIRSIATNATDFEVMRKDLFGTSSDSKDGFLKTGKVAKTHWLANGSRALIALENIINNHANGSTVFVAKFAAEMAKTK